MMVSFQMNLSWGSGLQGAFTLKNTGTTPVDNWIVQFDYANTIDSIWGGRILSELNGKYRIGHLDWNSTIAAGDSATIGFLGGQNLESIPDNFMVTGNGLGPVPVANCSPEPDADAIYVPAGIPASIVPSKFGILMVEAGMGLLWLPGKTK